MSDPLANMFNLTGAQGMYAPNPYLMFTGQIPLAGYAGTPTDAQGRPIAGYNPGTTLNTPPSAAAAPTGQPDLSGLQQQMQLAQMNQGSFGGTSEVSGQPGGGSGAYANQVNLDNMQRMANIARAAAATQQQQAAPAAAPAAQPSNAANQRQAYLNALANPGQVTTPGAQMMPGAQPTGTPQPSVLAQFLAAHPSGGTTGAGGYTNRPFFATLNALQQGGKA